MRSQAVVFLAVCSLAAALKMDDKALFFRSELENAEVKEEAEDSPDRLSRQAAMDPKIRSILEFIQEQYTEMRKKKSANTDPKFLLLSPRHAQPSLHYIPVQVAPTKSKPSSFYHADNVPASDEINQQLDGYSRDDPKPAFPFASQHSGFSSPKPNPTKGHSSSGSSGGSSSSHSFSEQDNFVTRPAYSSPQQNIFSSPAPRPAFSSQQPERVSNHPSFSSQQPQIYSSPAPRPSPSSEQQESFSSPASGPSSSSEQQESFSSPASRPSFSSQQQEIFSRPASRPSTSEQPDIDSSPSPRPVYQSLQPSFSSPSPSVSNHNAGFSSPRPFAPSGSDNSNSIHPPHIHEILVECAKDKMTINIEFDRVFDGEIYAKGYYKECRFVNALSGKKKYSFMVSLNSCGTQFVERFKEGGQAYLENVLVLQNERGIQEVWDTIRSVRCLWEGSIKKALSSGLSVDQLSHETVTFSGDTAVARLDIQVGRGPLAPVANGLVKIGEIMTLVVSVEGDPDFDVHVRDCVARDESSDNVVQLTDDQGCVLKPKLLGAFQKTRDTGSSGASVIAYAFFQAFKFPEIMDLTLDCNVELCKTDCEMCPDPNQKVEPGRRRRSADNSTFGEPARISRTFRIVAAEDFAISSSVSEVAPFTDVSRPGVCLSMPGFMLTSALLISVLIGSCSLTGFWWLKAQKTGKGLA